MNQEEIAEKYEKIKYANTCSKNQKSGTMTRQTLFEAVLLDVFVTFQ